jgi:hypothetical protein
MRNRFGLSALFLLLISVISRGQYYDTGQDPANLKWLQIKTDRFTVIYPEKYGTGGIEFAKALDKAYSDLGTLFPQKRYQLPVIIHNFTTESNGYVAWAPRRMEIYPTPEQNGIPLDPNRQLALHELTHVYQMESLNRGFTRAVSFIMGQQFTGAMAVLLPQWYMEGEAVFAESVLSESGRGRSPSFQKGLKAISVERGKMYKYDKIVNGSFKNYVPDHYQSGYQIVAWTNAKYDPLTWNKALKLTANAPFLINPVSLSLRSSTGLNKRKLFLQTFDTLGKAWKEETLKNRALTYKTLNPEKGKNFANYYSPVKITGSNYIAIKTTLYNPPEFVRINPATKKEDRILVPGYMSQYHLSAGNMTLAWVEYQADPRWENRNYSIVKILDLRNNSVRQLSWKSRYMSAAISPDGKTIAATENTPDNKNSLVFINTASGKILKSVPVPDNAYLQRPQWSANGSEITFITLTDKGEGIRSFSISDQLWRNHISERAEDFQSAFIRNDSLFFVSSSSGTENLYVLSPEKKMASVTNARFGATDFLISGNNVIFCDYTSSGNNLCITRLKEAVQDGGYYDASYFIIDRINPIKNLSETETGTDYVPEKYRKALHLFGFHSWMPFYADMETIQSDPLSVKPGLSLLSQNNLSTLITSLGYEYSGGLHKFHSLITWKGWYPVIESRLDYGDIPYVYKPQASIDDPYSVKSGITSTNTLYIPLIFRLGKFTLFLRPSASIIYQNNYLYSEKLSAYDYGQTQFSGRFYFSNAYTTAERDIFPRLAQVVDLYYSWYPFDGEYYGTDLTVRTAFYFPGVFRNNSLRIRFENEFQSSESFLNFNLINFPRGYKNIISEDLTYVSGDYSFPIVYPDLNIGSLIYLKRIRGGLFFDYAAGINNYYLNLGSKGYEVISEHKFKEYFSSYGVELISDFHVLRLPYMVSAGVQAAWQKGQKVPSLEAIFNINIYGMSVGKKPRL